MIFSEVIAKKMPIFSKYSICQPPPMRVCDKKLYIVNALRVECEEWRVEQQRLCRWVKFAQGASDARFRNDVCALHKWCFGFAKVVVAHSVRIFKIPRLRSEWQVFVISTEAERSLDLRSGWHEKSDKIGTKTSLFRGTPRWQKQ